MFTNISWQDYIIAVAITLTVYYVVIGLRYYLPELKHLFSGKWKLKFGIQVAGTEPEEDDLLMIPSHRDNEDYFFEPKGDDEFREVEELISRLKDSIQNASKERAVLEEFKQSLRLLLTGYPTVKSSPFRSSVNEFIVSECDKYDFVTMAEEDVDQLWNKTRQ